MAAARPPSASIGICAESVGQTALLASALCARLFFVTYSGSALSGRPRGSPSANSMGNTTLPARAMLSARMRSVLSAISASRRMPPICSNSAFAASEGGACRCTSSRRVT